MSSKRAMKQAQKQAYAKHRSNITNSRFWEKNRNSIEAEEYADQVEASKNLVESEKEKSREVKNLKFLLKEEMHRIFLLRQIDS